MDITKMPANFLAGIFIYCKSGIDFYLCKLVIPSSHQPAIILGYDCQIVVHLTPRRMIMTLVEISQTQGRIPVTVFQLQDRVNLGNYKELEQTAQQAFDNGMRDLVIDLSQTPSLTSIGIRALVVIHKILMKDGGGKHLKLAEVTQPIYEMFEIAGITTFLEIYDTVDEAVASF